MSNLKDFYRQKGLNELKGKVDSNRFLTTEQRELIHQIIDEEMDNDVKDKLKSMSDKQKRSLKRKLSGQNEETEEVKEIKDVVQEMVDAVEEVVKDEEVVQEMVDAVEEEVVSKEQTLEFSTAEKQEALIKFGYDPTNVRYMNSEVLEHAFESMNNILNAQNPR
jgi:hypothetical protein